MTTWHGFFTTPKHTRAEKRIYRLAGVNADTEQGSRSYALSVVGFSIVSVVALMAIQIGQAHLPFDRGLPGVGFWMSFNTAASFVANTNWQSYGGESTLGFAAQMGGLTVQNFLSAAVGISVAIALIRGFDSRSVPGSRPAPMPGPYGGAYCAPSTSQPSGRRRASRQAG